MQKPSFVIDYFAVILPNGMVRYVKSELIQKKWPILYENIKGQSVFGLPEDVPNSVIEYVFSEDDEKLHVQHFNCGEEIEKIKKFNKKYGKDSIPGIESLLAISGITEVKKYKHPDGKWFLEKYSEVQLARRKFINYMLENAKVDMRIQITHLNGKLLCPHKIIRITEVESMDYTGFLPIKLDVPSPFGNGTDWISHNLPENNFRLLDDDE